MFGQILGLVGRVGQHYPSLPAQRRSPRIFEGKAFFGHLGPSGHLSIKLSLHIVAVSALLGHFHNRLKAKLAAA
jgi:hypothetical protein